MPRSTRRFYIALALITLLGLAIRLFYMFNWRWDQRLAGDAFLYHSTANGLVDGFGFAKWLYTGHVSLGPSAEHPPMFSLYLAAWSALGLRTYHWHMIATTMLGTGAVFMMGIVGRKIGGNRVGLISATLGAVYANFWVYDPIGTSESMAILFGAVVVVFAYRAWESPTWKRIAVLGVVSGFGALTRTEFVVLLPVIMVPFVVSRMKKQSIKERFTFLAVAGAAMVIVMSPWVIRNLATFEKTTPLTSAAGVTLAASNCNATYYGDALGWWSPGCVAGKHPPKGDLSVQDAYWMRQARDYVGDHLDRLPVVLAARLGRMWELYHPGSPFSGGASIHSDQKIGFDITEGRSEFAARIALLQFYLLIPLTIAGVFILRRRKLTVAPLLALVVVSSFMALYSFGNTRYRAIAEVAIVALGAVTMDCLLTRYWHRNADAVSEPPPEDRRAEALQAT